jgi:hypothetical protein
MEPSQSVALDGFTISEGVYANGVCYEFDGARLVCHRSLQMKLLVRVVPLVAASGFGYGLSQLVFRSSNRELDFGLCFAVFALIAAILLCISLSIWGFLSDSSAVFDFPQRTLTLVRKDLRPQRKTAVVPLEQITTVRVGKRLMERARTRSVMADLYISYLALEMQDGKSFTLLETKNDGQVNEIADIIRRQLSLK